MASATDYLENALLDHVFGGVVYTQPTTIYMGLLTADPTDATIGTEVSGGGYARQAVTFNAAAGGVVDNDAAVAFTASGADFGTITAIAYYDALTAGNMLVYDDTVTDTVVNDGGTLTVAIGGATITMD